jgi:hypothetical protein
MQRQKFTPSERNQYRHRLTTMANRTRSGKSEFQVLETFFFHITTGGEPSDWNHDTFFSV